MWKLRDPIQRVRAYLVRTGQAEPAFFADVDAEAKLLGARVREACRTMPDPPPLTIFDNVYAEPNPMTAILRPSASSTRRTWTPSRARTTGGPGDDHAQPVPGAERGTEEGVENIPRS